MATTIANVLVGVATLEVRYPVGGVYVEVGYTEDGVRLEYTADTADVDVEEETFSIGRVITKETLAVICNMAETSLYNIDKAIAGSSLAAATVTIGPTGGSSPIKEMSIKLTGIAPAGAVRTIEIPLATATGAVGQAYRKGEKTVVPVIFQALINGTNPAATIVDA